MALPERVTITAVALRAEEVVDRSLPGRVKQGIESLDALPA